MDNAGSKVIKLAVAIVLVGIVVCAAYGAGFGSGYYAHGIVSSRVDSIACPPPSAIAECPAYPGVAGDWGATGPTVEEEEAFRVFWEVWSALKEDYYGDLPDAEGMTEGAIRGMLQTLDDRFTSYIEPNIARVLSEDATGAFEGIGAWVRINEEDKLEISRPFKGQAAERAGVQAGDVVIAIDGESIAGYGLYEAIGLIRGPADTQVTLTIEREEVDESFDITITRARIDIPILEYEMLEDDIAYVHLFEFSSPATKRMGVALKELLAQKPKGLIFDLRDNPGGFLRQSIEVSDLFLQSGIVAIERSSDGEEEVFRATRRGLAQDIPMVVLVNIGSASASEIVAGALQDNGRAVLIGEQSFGKGSVQLPRTLSNGGELRITIAHWFTPNDRAIHDEGLSPDIEVTLTIEDAKAGRDPQLDRAIEYFTTGK